MTTRFCTNCGVPRVEGAAFCPSCGAQAEAAQPGVQPPPPEPAAPPPLAAAPPPAPPAYPPAPAPAPAPVYQTEAKQPPWILIIAGVLGLGLAVLAILYFTGVLGGSRDARLVGTWGPGCPADRSDVITFSSDHRFVRPGASGTWSLSGDQLTLQANGQSLAVRWQWTDENSARLTAPGIGSSIIQYRCN